MSETHMELKKIDLDALEAALAKAVPGEWTVTLDDTTNYSIDDGPCDVVIPEINRILHSPEWADGEDFAQDVANAEAIVAAHNALPALISAARFTVPEIISEKHRDGRWWWVWNKHSRVWMAAHYDHSLPVWYGITGFRVFPTHALPMPPEVKP